MVRGRLWWKVIPFCSSGGGSAGCPSLSVWNVEESGDESASEPGRQCELMERCMLDSLPLCMYDYQAAHRCCLAT